jgi:hypothetical protein
MIDGQLEIIRTKEKKGMSKETKIANNREIGKVMWIETPSAPLRVVLLRPAEQKTHE